jgi:tRNA G18 (ribose-2'-O)-methylase SpoU
LTGYTPYPLTPDDERLPHIAQKVDKQIVKTALGAEKMVAWEYREGIAELIDELHREKYLVTALEQRSDAVKLPTFHAPERLALIVGREVEGIEPKVLALTDRVIEIPMLGRKESFNVAQAAAMALYHCRFS